MTAAIGRAPLSGRGLLTAPAAVVLLAAGSTVTVAAAAGAVDTHRHGRYALAGGPSCAAPQLSGPTVSVRLVDMRSMMTRGMMGGPSGMMSHGDWRSFQRGMMRLLASPTWVPAGTVSLTVTNSGYLTHELVVLPLSAGQQPGTRAITAGGTVDEAGSRGEASATCAAGAGDGIGAGSTGWVTVNLPAGRYELVCNLPGHYASDMYSELDVR